jgi:RNA polymerase sigma-70 factor (ECF subfamily)
METRFAPASDQKLLAWRRRDPGSPESRRAASELLGRYRERIYRWCRRYVHEHEQALDLSQDVLLTAFQHLDGLPEETRFGAWIYTVTRNRCLLEIRRLRVREGEVVDPDVLPASGRDPEEELLDQLAEDRFLDLIGSTLDAQEQEAICLRCFERLPVDEVTRVLGLTSSTGARGLLQRARRKLRAALEGKPPEGRRSAGASP